MFPPNEGTGPLDNASNQSPRGFENANVPQRRRTGPYYYDTPPRDIHDRDYFDVGFNVQRNVQPVYPQNQNPNFHSGHTSAVMIGFNQQPPPTYQQHYYDATYNGNFAQEMNPGQANAWAYTSLPPTAPPYVPLSERQHWQQSQGHDSPVASSQPPYHSSAPAFDSPAYGSPQRYVQATTQNQTPKRSTLRATASPFYPAHMRQNAVSPSQAAIEETPIIKQSARAKIYEQMPVPDSKGPASKKKTRGGGFGNGNQRPEVVIPTIPSQRYNSPRRRPLAESPVQSLTRPSVGQWKGFEEEIPAPRGAEQRAAVLRRLVEDRPEYDESPLRPREMDPVLEFELARATEEGYARYNNQQGSPTPER